MYWGKLDNANGPAECDYNYQPVLVEVAPELKIDSNVVICIGDYININASGGGIYQWFDPTNTLSDTTRPNPIASPKETTNYEVLITDTMFGCTLKTSVLVNVLDSNTELYTLCNEEEQILIAPEGGILYNWSTGEATQAINIEGNSNDPQRVITVRITGPEPDSCMVMKTYEVVTVDDCDPLYFIPNAFTPGTDGLNDFLSIRSQKLADNWKIHVYERRGKKVYEGQKWDGTFNGKEIYGVVVVRLEGESLYKFNDQNKVDPNGTTKMVSEIRNVSVIR